ncbi:VTT domain-containing protein [Georgenia sp. 10Sc9-8]|uniref:VTT domain-containing protein n=1 Tax=Georgenia halotolerans TaxID=3028317 RepID=A0ABT5TYH0_9MICO|nr:VTT domain-containing protein [Georgenia halotolerans]
MPEFLTTWPFWLVFAFMFSGALVRGQATYWTGRVVTEQALRRTHPQHGWRRRAHEALQGAGTQRGVDAIRRWGLVAVPFSFLTVGLLTMVNAGAGVLRIRWSHYTVAMVPGALAWALIYSTIGWAVWSAALAAAAGSPAGIAGLVVVTLLVVGAVVTRRRRARLPDMTRALDVPAEPEPRDGSRPAPRNG